MLNETHGQALRLDLKFLKHNEYCILNPNISFGLCYTIQTYLNTTCQILLKVKSINAILESSNLRNIFKLYSDLIPRYYYNV